MSEPPPFPDSSLIYESPPLDRSTGKRTAAWISLLIMGILYALGGLCMAGGAMIASAAVERAMAAGPAGVPPGVNIKAILMIAGLVFLVLLWAMGGTYLWTAFLVRRGSRAAAVTSLIVASLNVVGIMAIIVLGTIGILIGPTKDPQALIGIAVYLVPVAANLWLVIALIMFLREKRRATV